MPVTLHLIGGEELVVSDELPRNELAQQINTKTRGSDTDGLRFVEVKTKDDRQCLVNPNAIAFLTDV